MKFLFFLFLISSLSVFSQNNTAKLKDYNFEFTTTGQYTNLHFQYRQDSVKKTLVPFISDSTYENVPVVVKKSQGRLQIVKMDVADNQVFYDQPVKFYGYTRETYPSIIYKSDHGETILLNPSVGFVTVSFQECTSKDQRNCPVNNHYFGNADLKVFRP